MCGKLLNKQPPEDDDHLPCYLFNKFSKKHVPEDEACIAAGEGEYYYVDAKDVPLIIFSIFKDKPDKKRVNIAQIINKVNFTENKHLIEHVIE